MSMQTFQREKHQFQMKAGSFHHHQIQSSGKAEKGSKREKTIIIYTILAYKTISCIIVLHIFHKQLSFKAFNALRVWGHDPGFC